MGLVGDADAAQISALVVKLKILKFALTITVARSAASAPVLYAVLPTGRQLGVEIVLFTRWRNGII